VNIIARTMDFIVSGKESVVARSYKFPTTVTEFFGCN